MWSALAKLFELFLERSRLWVHARWTAASGEHAYAPAGRALEVTVINPAGHDIPIDAITVCTGTLQLDVQHTLCSSCPEPPTVVPARDRCRYWLGQDGLGRLLLQQGLSGSCEVRIEVRHATGRISRSDRLRVDLEILRLWLWIESQTQNLELTAGPVPAQLPIRWDADVDA